jgi:hypothetical protein
MTVLSGGRKDCGDCRPRDLGDRGSVGGVRLAAAGKRKDRGDGGDQGDAGGDAQTHGHRVTKALCAAATSSLPGALACGRRGTGLARARC